MDRIIEITSYNLKPGTREQYHQLVLQTLPLLKKWNIHVVAYGRSVHDSNSYFLIRSYRSIADREQQEDAFYGSDDWRKGAREAVLAKIINYTTIVLPNDAIQNLTTVFTTMTSNREQDGLALSHLNAQFIKNFISGDVKAHEELIHPYFVCIENDGSIVNRTDYMKAWANDYKNSNISSFTYTDEYIRIFGNTALVRSKTVYTKNVNGKTVSGNSVYTDTYVKENGRWLCVQAQITPVKNK